MTISDIRQQIGPLQSGARRRHRVDVSRSSASGKCCLLSESLAARVYSFINASSMRGEMGWPRREGNRVGDGAVRAQLAGAEPMSVGDEVARSRRSVIERINRVSSERPGLLLELRV